MPNHTTVAVREHAVLVPTRNETANIEELLVRHPGLRAREIPHLRLGGGA